MSLHITTAIAQIIRPTTKVTKNHVKVPKWRPPISTFSAFTLSTNACGSRISMECNQDWRGEGVECK